MRFHFISFHFIQIFMHARSHTQALETEKKRSTKILKDHCALSPLNAADRRASSKDIQHTIRHTTFLPATLWLRFRTNSTTMPTTTAATAITTATTTTMTYGNHYRPERAHKTNWNQCSQQNKTSSETSSEAAAQQRQQQHQKLLSGFLLNIKLLMRCAMWTSLAQCSHSN